jgi:hypothetical protein
MRPVLDGVEVCADEARERCSTTIQAAGLHVVVVESVVVRVVGALRSCYPADLSGHTAVSHLRDRRGRPQRSGSDC